MSRRRILGLWLLSGCVGCVTGTWFELLHTKGNDYTPLGRVLLFVACCSIVAMVVLTFMFIGKGD